jgi:hypothetical protein
MYLKTANLLTGETEATLEEQAKVAEGIKQVKHEVYFNMLSVSF